MATNIPPNSFTRTLRTFSLGSLAFVQVWDRKSVDTPMISGMMNQLMTSGTSLDQGDFTSSRPAVTPPRPITQYSPISPLIAQSSPNLFKKMIGKNLFASIQKGFDEYEATKTQREEVKERVDRQIESGPVTVRARQAFVANSVAINEDIRMNN